MRPELLSAIADVGSAFAWPLVVSVFLVSQWRRIGEFLSVLTTRFERSRSGSVSLGFGSASWTDAGADAAIQIVGTVQESEASALDHFAEPLGALESTDSPLLRAVGIQQLVESAVYSLAGSADLDSSVRSDFYVIVAEDLARRGLLENALVVGLQVLEDLLRGFKARVRGPSESEVESFSRLGRSLLEKIPAP